MNNDEQLEEIQEEELQEEEIQKQNEDQDEDQNEDQDEDQNEDQGEDQDEDQDEEKQDDSPVKNDPVFDRLKDFREQIDSDAETPEELLTDLETWVRSNIEANKKVVEVLTEQPEIGNIIRDMSKGATFSEALARHVDIEALKPEEGDPDFAAWEKAKKERKKRQRQMREYELQIAKNREESIKNITSFRSSKELSESEMNKFTEKLQETLSCVMDGSITQEFLDLMWKALNFETAVNEGRNQGEIRGRNTKIEEIKWKDQKTDGLPHLQSQGTVEKKKVDEVAKSIVTFQKNRRRFD